MGKRPRPTPTTRPEGGAPARLPAADPAVERSNRRGTLLVGAVLVLLVAAVYGRTAGFEFVNLDDRFYVRENAQVMRGITWDGAAWAFTTFEQANWHPLTWLSHMLDVTVFGPGAGGPHLVNASLHAANAVLLFAWLRSATGALWRSAAVAALFAVHPLHVESVAWVAERKDVLSTFFWFVAAWAWLRWARDRRRAGYALALCAFAASLLAKPTAVTFPCTLLLLDAWPLRRTGDGGLRWTALVREKLPFFALAAASAVVTCAAQATVAMATLERIALGPRLVNAVVAYGAYLVQTVWPAGLCVLYPHPVMSGGAHAPWAVAGAAALIVALSAVAWRLRRAQPWVAWGWCWYLGTLVPMIGIVQVGFQARADRYTYVPLVGVFTAAVWAAAAFVERGRVPRAAAVAAGATVVAALAVVSFGQTGTWRDSVTLTRHATEVTEGNAVAWAGLGDAYLERGETETAIAAYRRAIEMNPAIQSVGAHLDAGLGVAAGRAGRHEEAISWFRRSLDADPSDATTWFNLGSAHGKLGRHADAAAAFEEVLRLRPADARALAGLAIARIFLGDRAGALDAVRRLEPLDPARAAALRAEIPR